MKKNYTSETRRRLLKGMAALPFMGSLVAASAAKGAISKQGSDYLTEEARTSLKDLTGVLPKGKLGKHEISRLVIGCNPMGGWSHSRDLRYVSTLSKRWHTDQKMKETWAICEQAGINFANLEKFQYPVFNEYKKETGSKMLNVRQCNIGQPDDRLAPVKEAIDLGADFVYIQGANGDNLYRSNAIDVFGQALEYVHSQGHLFGIGAHSIQTILASIKAGITPDFYYKTFHHDNYWSATPREYRVELKPIAATAGVPAAGGQQGSTRPPQVLAGSPGAPRVDRNSTNDNMWDLFPEQTIEAFKSIKVPFFGFKVLAAGALTPADGIRWAFENGADFVCAGMYDWQIVDDVNTTIDILGSLGKRERPWYA
ncbi:hypothetical protein MUP95_01145 [bacterium]|nr:hypothetical protein [bacterium]